MEFMTNRKLTALQTDNMSKDGFSTNCSFGVYFFYMQLYEYQILLAKPFIAGVILAHPIERYANGDVTAGVD